MKRPKNSIVHPVDGTVWITANLDQWYDDDIWSTVIIQRMRKNWYGRWVRVENWKKYNNITDMYKEFEL